MIKHQDDARAIVVEQLAIANRILSMEGVVDAFGHVSQRSPERPDHFLISHSIAPSRVTPADIIELDLAGDPVDPTARPSYLERFIHAEIYRLRPDVQAVIHSHSPTLLPFSVVPEQPLRCVCHTAGFVGQAVPIFEIRDEVGENSDLLVRSSELGSALARTLGQENLVLMRGHGSTTVGRSLPQAVFHAVYAEVNARVQILAMQLGPVTYLTPGESLVATSSDAAVERAWDMWAERAEKMMAEESRSGSFRGQGE